MKFKLGKSKLEGLELLIRVLLNTHRPTNNAERLVYSHMAKVHNKLRAKTESMSAPRSGWNLSITDQEEWALHTFYEFYGVDEESYKYESIEFIKIYTEIDQYYKDEDSRNRKLASGTSPRRLGSAS